MIQQQKRNNVKVRVESVMLCSRTLNRKLRSQMLYVCDIFRKINNLKFCSAFIHPIYTFKIFCHRAQEQTQLKSVWIWNFSLGKKELQARGIVRILKCFLFSVFGYVFFVVANFENGDGFLGMVSWCNKFSNFLINVKNYNCPRFWSAGSSIFFFVFRFVYKIIKIMKQNSMH